MYISKLRQILSIQYLIGWFVVVAEGRGSIWRAGLACRERPHVVQTSPPDQLGQVWISLSVYIRIHLHSLTQHWDNMLHPTIFRLQFYLCTVWKVCDTQKCWPFANSTHVKMMEPAADCPAALSNVRCFLPVEGQRQPLGQQWCSKVGILLGGLYTNVLGCTQWPLSDLQHLRWKGVVAQAAVWGGDDRPWCQGVGAAEEEDWAALATSL